MKHVPSPDKTLKRGKKLDWHIGHLKTALNVDARSEKRE